MGIMDPVTAAGRLGGRHGLGGLPAQEQKMMKTDIKKPRVAPFVSDQLHICRNARRLAFI